MLVQQLRYMAALTIGMQLATSGNVAGLSQHQAAASAILSYAMGGKGLNVLGQIRGVTLVDYSNAPQESMGELRGLIQSQLLGLARDCAGQSLEAQESLFYGFLVNGLTYKIVGLGHLWGFRICACKRISDWLK